MLLLTHCELGDEGFEQLNPELQPLEDGIREHRDELKAWF
jgi:hypothetical protein